MDSVKMMAFGKQVNLVPETLGVHIEETEDKLLDIPLVADKVGSLSEGDIVTKKELNEYVLLGTCTPDKLEETEFELSESLHNFEEIDIYVKYSNLVLSHNRVRTNMLELSNTYYLMIWLNGPRWSGNVFVKDAASKMAVHVAEAADWGITTLVYGLRRK